MKLLFSGVLLILLLCFAPIASAQKLYTRQTNAYFSTISMLSIYADEDQDEQIQSLWMQVKNTLSQIDSAISVSEKSSDIARFNALKSGERCEISSITVRLLTLAKQLYQETYGLYDPTIYPLVDLWGFSPRFNSNSYHPSQPYDRAYVHGSLPMPNPEHITALLPLVGFDGIVMEEQDGRFFLRKNIPSVCIDGIECHAQIDLGGIAKGYACDLIMQLLRDSGVQHGHFLCGGSSMSFLSHPNESGIFSVTLKKPRTGLNSTSAYAAIPVQNTSLSTSADNSHSFIHEDTVFCHIIDPRTGWPVNTPIQSSEQSGLATVTVIGPSSARNDALSTALMVMGFDAAKAYVSHTLSDEKAIMVYFAQNDNTTFRVWSSIPGTEIWDPAYHLSPL